LVNPSRPTEEFATSSYPIAVVGLWDTHYATALLRPDWASERAALKGAVRAWIRLDGGPEDLPRPGSTVEISFPVGTVHRISFDALVLWTRPEDAIGIRVITRLDPTLLSLLIR
jgi:hypothetical protein